jgi:hypothetical protein
MKELSDTWGVQSLFFVRSPNIKISTLLAKASGTEAKHFLNKTTTGSFIKKAIDTESFLWLSKYCYN